MIGTSRVLPVPYFAQPTGVTCQSTVLKMFATYLEDNVALQSTGAADRAIPDIWKDINQDPHRPVKAPNAHLNMKWWLEKHFPRLRFQYLHTPAEDQAQESIVRFVDGGFPVLVSVSHMNVKGHIILVTGYEDYVPNASSPDFKLVVHDPYGRFDPSLSSKQFGNRRWEGGMSLASGGESGPGMGVRLAIDAVGRHRASDAARGTWYLLSGSR